MVDFSGDFCGVDALFSRTSFSGLLVDRGTVRIVGGSSFRRVFVPVPMTSFDAVRGLIVRFLSSVLFTSIRRSAYYQLVFGAKYRWR